VLHVNPLSLGLLKSIFTETAALEVFSDNIKFSVKIVCPMELYTANKHISLSSRLEDGK